MQTLNQLFDYTTQLISRLDLSDTVVFTINILLIIFARRILRFVYHAKESSTAFRVHLSIFRLLNLLIIIAFSYYHIFSSADYKYWGYKAVLILLVVYLSFIIMHVIQFQIRDKFGVRKIVGEERQVIDTYATRLTNVFIAILIFSIALIVIIKILGFNSLLEASGVLGFVGVLLVVTNSFWAPDIFSGLVMLNSGMAEAGDIIELDDNERTLGQLYKIKLFHTVIRTLVNNHRVMIRNSRFRDHIVHNLSRFASAKGLRDNLKFKIDYAVQPAQARALFNEAFETLKKNPDVEFESQHPLEIGVGETGDYAVEWVIYYYTKDVKNLIRLRQTFLETILIKSNEHGISLNTPMQHHVEQPSVNT